MKRIREKNLVPLGPALPLATPFVINVDPSSACNFRCQFCFHAHHKLSKVGFMDWILYKRIIRDIKEFETPIKTLRLYAFGEPLLNPRFPDMVKLAKDEGVSEDIDTTTNGSFLTPEFNKRIIDAGLDRINISVIGVNSGQYKKFSKKELSFLRYVDDIADLYHNRGNCTVFIKINGDTISEKDKEKFFEIFEPISDGCAVEHVMNCWYDMDVAHMKRTELGVYGQPLTHVEVCPYIFYSFCIQHDGEVSACFLDWDRRLIVGDVNRNTVKEIWNGPKLRKLRRAMLEGKRHTIDICENCEQLVAGQPVNIDHLADKLLEKI